MRDFVEDGPGAPQVVDRSTFEAALGGLRIREKAHTHEGDAIAAARRRLPMVEIDPSIPLTGPNGPVTLLEAFEGRRLLIAYYFMWHTGHSAPGQCEGCTWVTTQVTELSYLHSRDVTLAVFCQGPYKRERAVPRIHGLGNALVLRTGLARSAPGWTPGGQDAHRLLSEARIQSLQNLLDDGAGCRGHGQQLSLARPGRIRATGEVGRLSGRVATTVHLHKNHQRLAHLETRVAGRPPDRPMVAPRSRALRRPWRYPAPGKLSTIRVLLATSRQLS